MGTLFKKIALILFIPAIFFLLTNSTYAAETFLDKQLTVENIQDDFGISPGEKIDQIAMYRFLVRKLNIAPFDAQKSAYLDWRDGDDPSEGFIPDPTRRALLKAAGITKTSTEAGMTPKQYLTYLRIGFGDGSKSLVSVKDFMVSLAINLNGVFNIRTNATVDDQYNNKFSIHRESLAYRQIFDYIGKTYYWQDNTRADPLKEIVLEEETHGLLLCEIFGNGEKLKKCLIEKVGVNEAVAEAVKNQFVGCEETLEGKTYKYGLKSFLLGEVESRNEQGNFYTGEPAMWYEIEALAPGIDLKADLGWQEICALVNVTGSWPDNPRDALIIKAPYNDLSPDVTADDLMEFVVAIGNALPNMPGALFADLIPQGDLDTMDAVVYNAEFEYHRLVIPYVYKLLNVGVTSN